MHVRAKLISRGFCKRDVLFSDLPFWRNSVRRTDSRTVGRFGSIYEHKSTWTGNSPVERTFFQCEGYVPRKQRVW
jgi:hypothetical protein